MCRGGGLNLDNTGADTGFPEGGGGEDIHKHHHPLGHCPCDVIRSPEKGLNKILGMGNWGGGVVLVLVWGGGHNRNIGLCYKGFEGSQDPLLRV